MTEHLHWREQGGLGHVRRDFAQDEEHDVQGGLSICIGENKVDCDAYDEISHKMKSMMFKGDCKRLQWREQCGLGHVRGGFKRVEEHVCRGSLKCRDALACDRWRGALAALGDVLVSSVFGHRSCTVIHGASSVIRGILGEGEGERRVLVFSNTDTHTDTKTHRHTTHTD